MHAHTCTDLWKCQNKNLHIDQFKQVMEGISNSVFWLGILHEFP